MSREPDSAYPALVDEKLFNFLKWWRHQWRHECMTHNMHNYTSPPIYLQTIVYAVSFHLIQIVGIMPNKHTNTIGEDITSLSRVINKINTNKHQIWTHTPKYFKNVCSSSTFDMHIRASHSKPPNWMLWRALQFGMRLSSSAADLSATF